jgi:hypothetical protein
MGDHWDRFLEEPVRYCMIFIYILILFILGSTTVYIMIRLVSILTIYVCASQESEFSQILSIRSMN